MYAIFRLHFTPRQQVWPGTQSGGGGQCGGFCWNPQVKEQLLNHACTNGKGGREHVRGGFVLPIEQRILFSKGLPKGSRQTPQSPSSIILFAQSLHFLPSTPSHHQMQSNSVTNFIKYFFCQSLHFPVTSTPSLVNPPRFHGLDILSFRPLFPSPANLSLTAAWPLTLNFPAPSPFSSTPSHCGQLPERLKCSSKSSFSKYWDAPSN